MKKALKILLYFFIIIILIKIISLFILPIPIEIRSKGLKRIIDFIFPLSIVGLSIIFIIKKIKYKRKASVLTITISAIFLVISFVIIFLFGLFGNYIYKDEHVAYKSIDNTDRIIQQFKDDGAFGSHWREVRVKNNFLGIRYSNRFCKTTLNGLWIRNDYKSKQIDTINFDNYIYESEINRKQNWISKKCE